MGCGNRLTLPSEWPSIELPFDEKINRIQRYLPKGLTEKILSQKDKIEGERKQVTVMFCDMEKFTPLVEKLGPEEAYSLMDQVYEILIHQVQDYEGTVNELTGDGILALFGAPIALEDAPQRAVRSAMAIHREMSRLSDELKQEREYLPPIKMRIGINTGPVVVGMLGNDLRVEFKAVGDTVNLASRVEGLAEAGATYVTEDTFRLTEGFFRFEALGEKKVKGKREPLKVYRVIASSTRRTRFDVSAERGLTPFVGRQRELALLLDALERAKEGRGQAISIMSEAGVGKSRLLYEFRKRVSNEDVTFLEGKCLSYSRGVAYHPIIEVLKSNFDVREEDKDSEISEKIKKGLKILGADVTSTLPYLLELFSVKDSGIDKIMMSPEGKKDQIIEALKRIVLKGSEKRPLVMAIEDLHWVDKSSEDVLKYLLESISGAPVFLIFTYRPEFVHTWSAKSFHNQLTLNRLSSRESLSMVIHLLTTEEVNRDLEELILTKTEGVPFFIEEFIRSFKDLKVIEKKDRKYELAKDIQGVSIPTTIHEVIMARVDSLPEGAKEVLQTGSVIEREFSYELITRIMNLPEKELLSHLCALKDSELVYEKGLYPQATLMFKHALTREVVYDSILTKKRKRLHNEIGQALEALSDQKIDERLGVLADHFFRGENYEKAAQYYKIAARMAKKKASLLDAITYAKRRISSLEFLQQTDDTQKEMIDSRTVLGLCYVQMNCHKEANEAVVPVADLALKLGYKERLSQIFTIMGTYNYLVTEDFSNAFEYLERALSISEEKKDIISCLFANFWLGMVRSVNCEFEKSIGHIEKALEINIAANSIWGMSTVKSNLSCFVYYLQGRIDLGYQTSEEARKLADKSGDILSKAMAYVSHGVMCFGKGHLSEATKLLSKGADFCEKIYLPIFDALAQFFLGKTYYTIGNYKKAKHCFDLAVLLLEQKGLIPSWANIYRIASAKAKVMNNEKDIDLESLYTYVDQNKAKTWDGWLRRSLGHILLKIDEQNLSAAEDWINNAIEADQKNGTLLNLGRDHSFLATLLKRKGNQREAKTAIVKAIEIFKDCGADGFLEEAEKALASL